LLGQMGIYWRRGASLAVPYRPAVNSFALQAVDKAPSKKKDDRGFSKHSPKASRTTSQGGGGWIGMVV